MPHSSSGVSSTRSNSKVEEEAPGVVGTSCCICLAHSLCAKAWNDPGSHQQVLSGPKPPRYSLESPVQLGGLFWMKAWRPSMKSSVVESVAIAVLQRSIPSVSTTTHTAVNHHHMAGTQKEEATAWHGRYGMVWYDKYRRAWPGMTWHDMVWYGMTWHGMA